MMKQGNAMHGSVVQGYFGIERLRGGAPGAWHRAPRPELLPGMGPARVEMRGVAQTRVAQARSNLGVSATPIPPGQLRVIGRGRPLDDGVRIAMEALFQTDFSAVRIHEGPAAAKMSALAFTLGDDLHFAPGLYDPSRRDGLALLAHELTHVVQQREGRVVNPYGNRVAIVQDPVLEAEADRMGQRFTDELWSGARGNLRATQIVPRMDERGRGGAAGAAQGKSTGLGNGNEFWSGKAPRPDLMPYGTPGAAMGTAVQGKRRAMAAQGGTRGGVPPPDMLPAAMRRSVVQRWGASASPVQVLQRMEMEEEPSTISTTVPTPTTPKDPWRHLDTATGSPNWPHAGNVQPLIQIAIARHIVGLLRRNQIMARIGGSVAALGYLTTRVPDDIDIDILPKSKRLDEGEIELKKAAELLFLSNVKHFNIRAPDGSSRLYQIDGFSWVSASQFVIALQINGRIIRNRHNPETYEIEIYGDPLPIKLQLINETAFTFMNIPRDPGTVGVEKYKEVAGFSRLVANCIGRYLQTGGQDNKHDLDRVLQMFRAKLLGAEYSKILRICIKIAHYFPTRSVDPPYKPVKHQEHAVSLLGKIVSQLRPTIDPVEFSKAVTDAMTVPNLLTDLQLSGLLSKLANS